MVHPGSRRPVKTTTRDRARRAWRRFRRSRASRHMPFAVYSLITIVGMGYTLVMICRATG